MLRCPFRSSRFLFQSRFQKVPQLQETSFQEIRDLPAANKPSESALSPPQLPAAQGQKDERFFGGLGPDRYPWYQPERGQRINLLMYLNRLFQNRIDTVVILGWGIVFLSFGSTFCTFSDQYHCYMYHMPQI